MSQMLSFNGRIISRSGFCLPPANRAFRYGDGIFESIRVQQGKPLWIQHHYKRLSKSADKLKFNIDNDWSQEFFEDTIISLQNANHNSNTTSRIRFSLFRNDGGLYTPFTNNASYLIESEPLDQNQYVLNTKGISIVIYPDIQKQYNILSGIKSINAQLYVLASIHKRNNGYGDALILNEEGMVSEATSSNIFIYKNGKLITPPLTQACVEGVMRAVIINIVKEIGLPFEEEKVSPDDLLHADEVFLTNAVMGIKWVKGYDNKKFSNMISTELVKILNDKALQHFI